MSNRIEDHAAAVGATFEPTVLTFDLANENREVFDALAAEAPSATQAIDSVRARIPLPRNSAPNVDGRFYRLPNHNRSFCYSLADSTHFGNSPVLVFKGTEPLLSDFGLMIDWMAQAPLRKSSRVMTDHFPLAEGKIPGAISLREALREAKVALHIQEKHLAHYGELARVPTPILVHSFPERAKDSCAALLELKLSQPAFDRIAALLHDGLAIYVYYYPSPPVRANYRGDMGASQFKRFVPNAVNEEKVTADWARLLVRLFYLGYLPYSVRNEGLGACMDFGNAALDGGFCDPDSIIEIDSSADDEFFRESVIQTLRMLENTIQLMLGFSYPSTLYPNIEEFACRQYVHHLIGAAVQSERRPGLQLDVRLQHLLGVRTIADVKTCADRKGRAATYTQFTKRSPRPNNNRREESYP